MKKAAIAISAALALAACGSSEQTGETNVPSPQVAREQAIMGGALFRVDFQEGTKCYVVDSFKSGALSCDFSNSRTGAQGSAGVIERADGLRLVRTSSGDICAVYDGFQASGLACRFN